MKRNLLVLMTFSFAFVIFPSVEISAAKHIINVQNYSFSPSSISNVAIGDTIRWVWVSGSHTTTSTTIPAGAAAWDSPINSTTTSYEYKVSLAGTYNYKCTPHAAMGMVGSFTVINSTPTLTVLPPNRSVSATAGSTTFTVTSNSNWTASSNQTWCSINTSGSGNGVITATYSANASTAQRVASITVMVTGLSPVVVTLTQSGLAPTLTVEPGNQAVGYQAGNTSFAVTSNSEWSAITDRSWCTATPTGNGNGTLVVTYSENPTNSIRVATITVNVDGIPPQMVTVTQDLSHVSVNKPSEKVFGIYPNPTSGKIAIVTGLNKSVPVEISVINAIGKTVYTTRSANSESLNFDLGDLAKGTYYVRMISVDGIKTSKIVLTD